ncbi:MAG: hypothetical protein JRH08_08180 [Deltaproteobacteria bacterium]|nr:hypothetical protein [Deltaproteobacteria bacterium]MBW2025767.1 hypothetical protein [Deltaproteobacteria bacterium]MBW2125660.1 hypothetical protein [Deltaproteobacteria bacterium]
MRYRPNKQNRQDRPNTAKWTVMVYMAGDNNLDTAAMSDIAEMARVGSSDKVHPVKFPKGSCKAAFNGVNILVQLDRANDFLTRRFFITRGGGYRKDCIETFEEINTGDPKVLEDFMLWAMEKYPANRYLLILWNHGGGWWEDPRRSIAYDDSSEGDALDNGELKAALFSITKKLGRPIDILGMDACLMNMVEVAYQLKDCVYVMVGSEEEEPFDGWPYDKVLQVLKNRPGRHPKTMGKEIVREYIKSYRGKGDEVTQSALNLRRMDDVVRNLDCLSHELVRSINDDKIFAAIASSWKDSPKFFYDNYIDLYRFTRLLKGRCSHRRIKEKAGELLRSLRPGRKKAIIYERHLGRRMRHTHGMSIYFPKNHINSKYWDLDFYKDCRWGEFIEKFLTSRRAHGGAEFF